MFETLTEQEVLKLQQKWAKKCDDALYDIMPLMSVLQTSEKFKKEEIFILRELDILFQVII